MIAETPRLRLFSFGFAKIFACRITRLFMQRYQEVIKILPVFVWDPEEGGQWSPGAASRWWFHHALKSLGSDISKLGGELILAKGKAAELIPKLPKIMALKKYSMAGLMIPLV